MVYSMLNFLAIHASYVLRLGESYANQHGLDTLINGESVGQVASQTLRY